MIYEVAAGVVLGLTIFYVIVFLIGVLINWIADIRWGKENPTLLETLKKHGLDQPVPEEKTKPRNLKPDTIKAMFSTRWEDM